MRVFKSKEFSKYAKKQGLSDETLRRAVEEIKAGQIEANYGGSVFKKRIARPGQGKSGGWRTILIYRQGDRTIFVHGFGKKDKANISKADEKAFKESAKVMLKFSYEDLNVLVKKGALEEI